MAVALRIGVTTLVAAIAIAAGIVPSADARRRATPRDPAAAAARLDTLGLRAFASGTPKGWEEAERLFRRALTLRERSLGAQHPGIAATLGNLATLADYQGRWAEALELARRALAIRQAQPGPASAAVAAGHRHVGTLLYQLGRYAEAEPELVRALAVYDSLGAPHAGSSVDALNALGEVVRAQGRYVEATEILARGLRAARAGLERGDPRRAAVLNNLAGLHKDLARFDLAEPLLLEFLAAVDSSAGGFDRETIATARLNLAEIYRLQGRAAEAEPLYAEGLATARASLPEGSPDLVPFVSQSAAVLDALGRHAAAETLYREAAAITARTVGDAHPLLAQSLHDLGGLLTVTGRHAEARATLERALAIRERALGRRHPEAAVTRAALATSLAADPAAGDARAAPLLAEALAVLERAAAYPEARLDAYALRAEMAWRAGHRDSAIADLGRALESVDALRPHRGGGDATRAGFLAGQLPRFDRMVEWRLASGDVAGAIETHERARARVLLDQLAAGRVALTTGIPADVLAPLAAREQAARERLAALQTRTHELRARTDLPHADRFTGLAALESARDSAVRALQSAGEAIRDRNPVWRDVLTEGGRPASLAALQRELVRRGELALVYHVGQTSSVLFVIPPAGRPAAVPLVIDTAAARVLRVPPGPLTSATLDGILVGREDAPGFGPGAPVAALLAAPSDEERALPLHTAPGEAPLLERRLHALARILMPEPTWRRVRGAARVIVVPDGALHVLPFEALVVRSRAGAPPRYWLDEGPPVRYGSSATALLAIDRRAAASRTRETAAVLSVTDPAFGATDAFGRSWPPLPASRQETEALRRAFGDAALTVLAGGEAREARVRATLAGKHTIHFATHGFVSASKSELLAGLALAPGPAASGDDDGLLQLYEIYALSLDADLAVLSACGTQRGPRVAGEGVFALSRGFLTAGCRRVVASLWAVNDASTAELMGGFFTALARRGAPDHARALRDAKRRLRADPRWADPFHWAPFVLEGAR